MIEQFVIDGSTMATVRRADPKKAAVSEDRGDRSPIETSKSRIKTIYGVFIVRNNTTLK